MKTAQELRKLQERNRVNFLESKDIRRANFLKLKDTKDLENIEMLLEEWSKDWDNKHIIYRAEKADGWHYLSDNVKKKLESLGYTVKRTLLGFYKISWK